MTKDQVKNKPYAGLAVFFAVLIVGSAALQWILIIKGDPIQDHLEFALPMMWIPAIASLAARIALREGARDVSFRFGGLTGARMLLLAWVFPLFVGGAAYGIAWTASLAEFQIRGVEGLPAPQSAAGSLSQLLAVQLTINTLINVIAVAGEEIGWRGYMLTRLIQAGVRAPIIVSGIIWGAWHVPMIIGGVYATSEHPLISAIVFTLSIIGQGIVLAHVRLASGSVWPAIIGHAAWNAVMQGVFDRSTGPQTGINWVGEDGMLVALICLGLAVVFSRGRKQTLLTPDTHLTPETDPRSPRTSIPHDS